MKKRRTIYTAAAVLTALLMLSSCSLTDLFGKAGITQPPSAVTSAPSAVTTSAEAQNTIPKPSLEGVDLSGYMTLEYKDLLLTTSYQKREITDEIVNAELTQVLIYYGYYTLDTSRSVAAGDWIEIDYTGYMDGVAFDGGHSDKATLIIDDEKSGYIPGFASGLIGAECGKETEVSITFPENYNASLAGKPAVFKMGVHGICLPNLTDEAASKLSDGKYTTADSYRAYFKDYLATMEEYMLFESVYPSIFERLEDTAVISSLHSALYDYYYNSISNYYDSMAAYYDMSREQVLSASGLTEESLKESAEGYTRSDMVLYYVANAEGIVMTDEIYNEYLQETLDYWANNGYNYTAEQIESMYNSYYGEGYLKEAAFREKVGDAVYSYARIEYQPESAEPEDTSAAETAG